MTPFVARRRVFGVPEDAVPELYLVLAFVDSRDRDYPIEAVVAGVDGAMTTLPVHDLIRVDTGMSGPYMGFGEYAEWLS